MAPHTVDEQELALLRALRRVPESSVDELARAVGLPRTNFGRRPSRRLRARLEGVVEAGLVEVHAGRYRLSERGRRTLADLALDGGL